MCGGFLFYCKSYEACEIKGIPRLIKIAARSSSDMPPQIPYGSCTASAWVRHAAITGHAAQIALAAFSRLRRRGPRSPSGWKNISESIERHEPSYCHSHCSAIGCGRRDSSAMWFSFALDICTIQPFHRLFKYLSSHALFNVRNVRFWSGELGHFTPRLTHG